MSLHIRALTPAPNTVDLDARTVEAIISTGAETQRPGYIERLDLSGADLSALVGAPVLDAHRSASTRDQLGVIEAVELRPEGIWACLKFRNNAAAQSVLADVGEGTLRGLSIGYQVTAWKDEMRGQTRVRTAIKWKPIEVSLVPVPADAGAHFRNGENEMPNDETTIETTDAAPVTMTRAETNAAIRNIADTAGLTRAWADAQIDADATADDARATAFEAMQQRSASTPTRTTRVTVGVDNTDPAVIVTRAGEALFARTNPAHEISAPARQYAGMTLPDLARDCLTRAGVSTSAMSVDTLTTRALHTNSDFSLILGDATGRELRRAYAAAPSGVRQLARQTTARDFRAKRALQFGEGPELEKVNEGGEFKHGTIEESAETYSVETFGRIFAISRQAIINDDVGAFMQIPAKLGNAARAFENAQLVEKIITNPAMSDGKGVFHADHGNLTAPYGDLGKATLGDARLAMRKQKGLSGELIEVTPRFVLVPAELETHAEQELAKIAATKTGDHNPFENLTLLTDARLTNEEQWYVAADPAMIDGLEYAYLEGAPGPQIETRQGFEVDGVQMKVRLDFGSGWVDCRGWHRVG